MKKIHQDIPNFFLWNELKYNAYYKTIAIIIFWKAINHHGLKTVTFAAPLNGVENGLAAFTQIEEFEEQQLSCRICDLSK